LLSRELITEGGERCYRKGVRYAELPGRWARGSAGAHLVTRSRGRAGTRYGDTAPSRQISVARAALTRASAEHREPARPRTRAPAYPRAHEPTSPEAPRARAPASPRAPPNVTSPSPAPSPSPAAAPRNRPARRSRFSSTDPA